jgi:hypothetical protein
MAGKPDYFKRRVVTLQKQMEVARKTLENIAGRRVSACRAAEIALEKIDAIEKERAK